VANTRDIVEQYFTALHAGDAAAARGFLADDLSFTGPAASISSADQYLRATEHAVRAVSRVETHRIFVDGQDACIFYELHLDQPVASIPVADFYHLENDKIASIQTILDTAPFISAPAANGESATDPVCGMTVARTSAAATRAFAGHTYFFCNLGCATAFDAHPEQYVSGLPAA
jgi:YHS domain-containing protein/ketosteroid isomerase-like protein